MYSCIKLFEFTFKLLVYIFFHFMYMIQVAYAEIQQQTRQKQISCILGHWSFKNGPLRLEIFANIVQWPGINQGI